MDSEPLTCEFGARVGASDFFVGFEVRCALAGERKEGFGGGEEFGGDGEGGGEQRGESAVGGVG